MEDVIRFTVTPSGNRTVTLQNFTAPYAAQVTWGDGTSDRITSDTPLSHTYVDATTRQISILGRLGGFWNTPTRASGTAMVTSLDEISSASLINLGETFRQCTALATLPPAITAPNLVKCERAFYQCKSVISDLPALWLSHPSAAHPGCFTSCFKSLYGQHGTGCSYRQYVAAVAGQTYYEKYGKGACPSATHHGAQPAKTFYQQYNNSCPNCTTYVYDSRYIGHSETCRFYNDKQVRVHSCTKGCGSARTWATSWHANYSASNPCEGCGCTRSSGAILYSITMPTTTVKCYRDCTIYYSNGSSAYSTCNQSTASGTSRCNSSCKRIFSSGQSAYYKCSKSGATCQTTNCPYPWANEASVNAAKAAGWA